MRGSRDVSLCSFVMRPSAVSSGVVAFARERLVFERARRGDDQLIVGRGQRVERRRCGLRTLQLDQRRQRGLADVVVGVARQRQ